VRDLETLGPSGAGAPHQKKKKLHIGAAADRKWCDFSTVEMQLRLLFLILICAETTE